MEHVGAPVAAVERVPAVVAHGAPLALLALLGRALHDGGGWPGPALHLDPAPAPAGLLAGPVAGGGDLVVHEGAEVWRSDGGLAVSVGGATVRGLLQLDRTGHLNAINKQCAIIVKRNKILTSSRLKGSTPSS